MFPMAEFAFDIILPATCIVVSLVFGGASERMAALIALTASGLTSISAVTNWRQFESAVFLIDFLVLVAFWFIVFRSRKFWPYWVTAWQLLTVMIHLETAAFPQTLVMAYGYMSMYMSIPIVLLIACAATVQRFNLSRYIMQNEPSDL